MTAFFYWSITLKGKPLGGDLCHGDHHKKDEKLRAFLIQSDVGGWLSLDGVAYLGTHKNYLVVVGKRTIFMCVLLQKICQYISA
jgi:hypothetical protein